MAMTRQMSTYTPQQALEQIPTDSVGEAGAVAAALAGGARLSGASALGAQESMGNTFVRSMAEGESGGVGGGEQGDGQTTGDPGGESDLNDDALTDIGAQMLAQLMDLLRGDGSGPGDKPDKTGIDDAGGAGELVKPEATVSEGGGGGALSKSEVNGTPRVNNGAGENTCKPDVPVIGDLSWEAVDAGDHWGVRVTGLATSGQINIMPYPSNPTSMTVPNTVNPVDGGNINNEEGSNNRWSYAIGEMQGYHTAGGGRSPHWHSTAASSAHEWAHWNTDWMTDSIGGRWPQANADLNAITVEKGWFGGYFDDPQDELAPLVEARFNRFSRDAVRRWNAIPDSPGVAGSIGYDAGQAVLDGLIARVQAYADAKGWSAAPVPAAEAAEGAAGGSGS